MMASPAPAASIAPRLVQTIGGRSVRLGRYRHNKGKDYLVVGVARHTETEEDMVYYQSLYGEGQFWVRPVEMFFEVGRFVEGQEACPRFKFVQDG